MCGIVGKFNYASGRPVGRELVAAMCDRIVHRGPDSEGIHIGAGVGMGMRRLRIIDLEGGEQPIANETETVWVVFNGEIYNFAEVRARLEALGHRFRTHSDTEVIVHAYEEFGLDCVQHFRGMFAFSLWDAERKRLFIARDRMGQKPLYYHERDGVLWYASELQCLFADPDVQVSINYAAVDYYFAFQYIPSPHTIYADVHKLLPGHYLLVEDGRVETGAYWSLDNRPAEGTAAEHAGRVRELAEEAVRLRLISDVPLGAFLSGGIDSSIIVGLMSQVSNSQVKTFSIGFEDEEFNELPYARMVANRFDTDHHEFIVQADVAHLVPDLVRHFGEPYGDSSAIPTYYVSKMARTEVTVALSGDAGDELFAGYSKYPYLERRAGYSPARKALNAVLHRALQGIELAPVGAEHPLRRVYHSMLGRAASVEQRDFMWMIYFDRFYKSKLYKGELRAYLDGDPSRRYYESQLALSPQPGAIDRVMYADIRNYLPDDLNAKVDITSMACSLEVRSPFLDHHFVEYAARVPAELKIRNGDCKHLLKRAFADLIPADIVNRPKMGFAIPIDRWFREDLKPLFEDVVLGSDSDWLRAHFDMDFIGGLFAAHQQGRGEHGSKMWLLLNFFLWHRTFAAD